MLLLRQALNNSFCMPYRLQLRPRDLLNLCDFDFYVTKNRSDYCMRPNFKILWAFCIVYHLPAIFLVNTRMHSINQCDLPCICLLNAYNLGFIFNKDKISDISVLKYHIFINYNIPVKTMVCPVELSASLHFVFVWSWMAKSIWDFYQIDASVKMHILPP